MDKLEKTGERFLWIAIAMGILFLIVFSMPKESEIKVSELKPKYPPQPGIIEKSCKETGLHCRALANHVEWMNK